MLVSTRQSLPRCLGIASAALVTCLLPTFRPSRAQAQAPAGRIYVATLFRLKPEGAEEERTFHGAIIAVDPATGDWQIIVERDPYAKGGAGNHVRVSPDRRTLVFWRHEDGIWKCESDGQFPFKIFDDQQSAISRLLWSPDGKHLVASGQTQIKRESKEVWQRETRQLDADGRNPVKLPIPDTDTVEDWSPDGQWFVTRSTREPRFGELYLMRTDGTQERRLIEGRGNHFARFSPDGKKIVYLRRANEGSSIWTVDFDGGNATELLKEAGLTAPDGAFWSPDGKQIAVVMFDWQFLRGEKVRGLIEEPECRCGIEIMDADGTNRRRIPLKGARFGYISPTADWR